MYILAYCFQRKGISYYKILNNDHIKVETNKKFNFFPKI